MVIYLRVWSPTATNGLLGEEVKGLPQGIRSVLGLRVLLTLNCKPSVSIVRGTGKCQNILDNSRC